MIQRLRAKFAPDRHKPQENVQNGAFDTPVIAWKAPEYIKHQKGRTWFIVAGIVILLLIAYGIKTGSFSTVLVFIVLAAVYLLAHTHEPRHLPIIISQMGIKIGSKCYPYAQIKAFWIQYHPPLVKTLNFRTIDRFFKEEVVQLDGQDPVPVRVYLARQIPEWEGKEEGLMEVLIRILRI
ncbi:hypothetical protein HZA41_00135 [Candidatus Peregrinibacteria bacterium]|nr:hypothetical protein [Candidatus Peregrinibacteria bacterium]